jgi:photosystem II stability/assembly factor-like uncharacterized protein
LVPVYPGKEFLMIKSVRLFSAILIAGCLILPSVAFSAAFVTPLDRPAIMAKEPARAVLLDVTLADGRLVAVGERGIIIYSDDSGNTWKQADVPTSVTLTAVSFPSPKNGWAVGHSGIVLHSTDSGKTWTRVMEGVSAAKLIFETAKANADSKGSADQTAQMQLSKAQIFVDDVKEGPDKPFLDVYFKNDNEGFIIGAYGLIFHTKDGGNTWQPWLDHTENEAGLNLYAIRASENAYYIVGEQGLFLASTDDGNSFKKIVTPYIGTFFDTVTAASGEIVLVGLLGNAYWSADHGVTFTKSEVPNKVSFSSAIRLENGTLMFSNQGGMIMVSHDNGHTIKVLDVSRLAPISSIISINKDTLMTVGYGGAVPVKLPASGSQEKGGEK